MRPHIVHDDLWENSTPAEREAFARSLAERAKDVMARYVISPEQLEQLRAESEEHLASLSPEARTEHEPKP